MVMASGVGCARREAIPQTGLATADLDFTLKDMDGRVVRLSDYKGRPLILNFWATWCGPCRQEIPAFVELAEKYKARNLTVLGVSVDDRPEALRAFAAQFKINYPLLVGLGEDRLQETYDAAMGIPITWFIGPWHVHLKQDGPATGLRTAGLG
jgi:thiol-disulfide isomerase/thioredoxin